MGRLLLLSACLVSGLALVHCGGGGNAAPLTGAGGAGSGDDDGGAPPGDAGSTPPPPLVPDTACNATDPRSTPVVVSTLPDDGEAPYVALLQKATRTIRVLGYEMGYGAVLDALQAKAKAGLDVRVILDGNTQRDVNDKYRAMLEAAGAKFQWSDPSFSYMHAKTMVVDETEAVVSTGNYGKSFLLKERNFIADLTEPQDVADIVRLFDADWSHTKPNLDCTRLLVSPVNSRDRLVALVASAKKTLVIESMQLSDHAVSDAVLARKAAGVDVRVLLAAPSWISENTQSGANMTAGNVPARWLDSPAVHVKAMVVDGTHAYLGSENVSYTSLSKNREVGLIVDDPAAIVAMTATFEKDWAAATSF